MSIRTRLPRSYLCESEREKVHDYRGNTPTRGRAKVGLQLPSWYLQLTINTGIVVRLLLIRVQRTWAYLTVSHKRFPLVPFLYYVGLQNTHTHTQSQFEISLKQQHGSLLVATLQSDLSLAN